MGDRLKQEIKLAVKQDEFSVSFNGDLATLPGHGSKNSHKRMPVTCSLVPAEIAMDGEDVFSHPSKGEGKPFRWGTEGCLFFMTMMPQSGDWGVVSPSTS